MFISAPTVPAALESIVSLSKDPWSGEDLRLKIEVRHQTSYLEKYSRIVATYFTLFKLNPDLLRNFLKNPPISAGHGLRCIESKN